MRSLEPVRGREAAGVTEGAHAGCSGCLDAELAVLDDDAGRWVDAHLLGGVQEQVRSWFAVSDLAGAEDAVFEVGVDPRVSQSVAHRSVAAAGGDAAGKGEVLENVEDAVHRGEFGIDGCAVEVPELSFQTAARLGPTR